MQCANFLGLQLKVNWGSKGTKGPAHLFLSASLGGLGSGLVTSREHLLPTQTSCYVIICWNKRDTLTPGARAHDGGVGRGTAARVPSQPERDCHSLTANAPSSVPSQPERDCHSLRPVSPRSQNVIHSLRPVSPRSRNVTHSLAHSQRTPLPVARHRSHS